MNRQQLEQRVKTIADNVLEEQSYVNIINVLLGIGYLQFAHLEDWRNGKANFLEQVFQVNLNKITAAMEFFQQWAEDKNLIASEIKYAAKTRGPAKVLQFSKSGDPAAEKAYRAHYFSPELSEKKRNNLEEKLAAQPEHIVFCILKDSKCDACQTELFEGSFLYKEQDEGLCMSCAGFDHLVFLPAGDAKLTRRVKQHSKTYVVVVKFSRARKRYERQGLLVEEQALKDAGG